MPVARWLPSNNQWANKYLWPVSHGDALECRGRCLVHCVLAKVGQGRRLGGDPDGDAEASDRCEIRSFYSSTVANVVQKGNQEMR